MSKRLTRIFRRSRKSLKSAEEKGFELAPTPVFKTEGAASDHGGLGGNGHGVDIGDVRGATLEALERMRAGAATTGEVAKLAAEVLANPPAVMVAARRYLNAVGTEHEHEDAAAVALLALLAGDRVGAQDVASRLLP